ncbi:hypothetical protein RJ640_018443 [Escallonia rubra]|uniref:Uncharacterized protein n=1 Tax=Escallonia rubra TaxID=112253 RepID=A0AA88UE10_9ASTE|nr:hypothetical protein RJ640_018443 [Escallonia rubra]
MGLLDDYEDRRSSLLNKNPAPTLAAALVEIKSEEVRKRAVALVEIKSEEVRKRAVVILALLSSNRNVLATPTALATSSHPSFKKKWCDFHKWGFHSTDDCKQKSKNYIPGYTSPRSLSQFQLLLLPKLLSSACSVASGRVDWEDLFPDTTTSLHTHAPADAIDPLAPGPDFPSTLPFANSALSVGLSAAVPATLEPVPVAPQFAEGGFYSPLPPNRSTSLNPGSPGLPRAISPCNFATAESEQTRFQDAHALVDSAQTKDRSLNVDPSHGRVMLIDGTSVIYRAYYKLLGKLELVLLIKLNGCVSKDKCGREEEREQHGTHTHLHRLQTNEMRPHRSNNGVSVLVSSLMFI